MSHHPTIVSKVLQRVSLFIQTLVLCVNILVNVCMNEWSSHSASIFNDLLVRQLLTRDMSGTYDVQMCRYSQTIRVMSIFGFF